MTKPIIVGVDGTSAGSAAIAWAARRASRLGRPLEILHVIDDAWGALGARQLAELHPEASRLVAEAAALAATVAPQLVCTVRVETGDPIVELVTSSRTANMVVVGTHKTGFFHGRALGSRSLQLAAASRCPVAIIPGFTSSRREGVLVGVDDSVGGDAALAFAAREARAAHEPLVLLHAIPPSRFPATPSTTTVAVTVNAITRARTLGATDSVRCRTVHRRPAEALIDSSVHAALVVLGSTRRLGSDLTALGPVVHDVLMNIGGPTVVVHADFSTPASSPTPDRTPELVDADQTPRDFRPRG